MLVGARTISFLGSQWQRYVLRMRYLTFCISTNFSSQYSFLASSVGSWDQVTHSKAELKWTVIFPSLSEKKNHSEYPRVTGRQRLKLNRLTERAGGRAGDEAMAIIFILFHRGVECEPLHAVSNSAAMGWEFGASLTSTMHAGEQVWSELLMQLFPGFLFTALSEGTAR